MVSNATYFIFSILVLIQLWLILSCLHHFVTRNSWSASRLFASLSMALAAFVYATVYV